MLKVFLIVLGDAKLVGDFQVCKNGGNKYAKAIAIDPDLTFLPGAQRPAELFKSFLIQFILNMIVEKFPDIMTCIFNGLCPEVFCYFLCIGNVFPYDLFH